MYAKHGNLVDADASGAKATTKHLESRLRGLSQKFLASHIVTGRTNQNYLDDWKPIYLHILIGHSDTNITSFI